MRDKVHYKANFTGADIVTYGNNFFLPEEKETHVWFDRTLNVTNVETNHHPHIGKLLKNKSFVITLIYQTDEELIFYLRGYIKGDKLTVRS